MAAGLVLGWAPAVLAAPPTAADLAAARALFAQAEADERGGRWVDALAKIRRAATVKMTPGLRFHIALCEERAGRLVAALDDYTAARTAARAENNRDVLDLVVEPIASLQLRTPTVTINLPARFSRGDAQAEVLVDGATLAPASVGTPVRVDVGSHTVQARAPGQTPYAMTLTVVERQAATVDVQFLPLARPESPGSGPVVPAPPPAPVVEKPPVAVPGPAAPAPAATEDRAPRPSRTLAITTTVGAVVLVAGGVAAYALAGADQSSSQGACASHPAAGCGDVTGVRAWDAVALGAWIAGAGVGVAAVVLWTRPNRGGGEAAHAELRAGPGALWLAGAF
jgi:hypothetical protein